MNRKDYDRLVTDMANGYENHELEAEHFAVNALNNVLIAEGIDIPGKISEQVWKYKEHSEVAGKFRIYNENMAMLADAYGEEMRDIICGIPALVKAGKSSSKTANITAALKAMGLDGE